MVGYRGEEEENKIPALIAATWAIAHPSKGKNILLHFFPLLCLPFQHLFKNQICPFCRTFSSHVSDCLILPPLILFFISSVPNPFLYCISSSVFLKLFLTCTTSYQLVCLISSFLKKRLKCIGLSQSLHCQFYVYTFKILPTQNASVVRTAISIQPSTRSLEF